MCLVGFDADPYNVREDVVTGVVEVCLVKRNNVLLSAPVDVLLTTGLAFDPLKDPATGQSLWYIRILSLLCR